MPSVRPSKKSNTGVPGVKLLITAASLAATVGGWALISAKETQPAQPAQPSSTTQVVEPVFSLKLAPLPTLVPPSQAQVVTISNPRAAAAAPQPAAAAPQTASQPTLVLRDVSAPAPAAPAPATNTRSSR
jgi:hypothetical protein